MWPSLTWRFVSRATHFMFTNLNDESTLSCFLSGEGNRHTVRLLTHVLCKPTHFFFHSFIATMSYPLQVRLNSVVKDWADKYHVWGTPRGHLQGQTRDNSNTRFFHTKQEQIYMCSYIISVVYMCRIISCLKGFVMFIIFHTYMECICRWKFIKNKKNAKMKHSYDKDKTCLIILKL